MTKYAPHESLVALTVMAYLSEQGWGQQESKADQPSLVARTRELVEPLYQEGHDFKVSLEVLIAGLRADGLNITGRMPKGVRTVLQKNQTLADVIKALENKNPKPKYDLQWD